jgi:hypothetical protein
MRANASNYLDQSLCDRCRLSYNVTHLRLGLSTRECYCLIASGESQNIADASVVLGGHPLPMLVVSAA